MTSTLVHVSWLTLSKISLGASSLCSKREPAIVSKPNGMEHLSKIEDLDVAIVPVGMIKTGEETSATGKISIMLDTVGTTALVAASSSEVVLVANQTGDNALSY